MILTLKVFFLFQRVPEDNCFIVNGFFRDGMVQVFERPEVVGAQQLLDHPGEERTVARIVRPVHFPADGRGK